MKPACRPLAELAETLSGLAILLSPRLAGTQALEVEPCRGAAAAVLLHYGRTNDILLTV